MADVVERLMAALRPDDTVIGGGNVKKLDALPRRCRAGENATLFVADFACGREPMFSRPICRPDGLAPNKKRRARNMIAD